MNRFDPMKAFYAACITIACLGVSYCSSQVFKQPPVIKVEGVMRLSDDPVLRQVIPTK